MDTPTTKCRMSHDQKFWADVCRSCAAKQTWRDHPEEGMKLQAFSSQIFIWPKKNNCLLGGNRPCLKKGSALKLFFFLILKFYLKISHFFNKMHIFGPKE